jgi:hypothetical protein
MQKTSECAVPDFSREDSRKAVENDKGSPWPGDAGPGQPPPGILGRFEPSPKGVALAKEVWREIGYWEG